MARAYCGSTLYGEQVILVVVPILLGGHTIYLSSNKVEPFKTANKICTVYYAKPPENPTRSNWATKSTIHFVTDDMSSFLMHGFSDKSIILDRNAMDEWPSTSSLAPISLDSFTFENDTYTLKAGIEPVSRHRQALNLALHDKAYNRFIAALTR
jgi:hypothetical protein